METENIIIISFPFSKSRPSTNTWNHVIPVLYYVFNSISVLQVKAKNCLKCQTIPHKKKKAAHV